MIEIMKPEGLSIPSPFAQVPVLQRHEVHLRSGETLFRQGDQPAAIYFVLSGALHLIRHTRAGVTVLVHRAAQGETLAEASLFADGYHCDCIAMQDSHLLLFNKSSVLKLLKTDAAFAASLVERLARQVQSYRRRLELLAISGAEERVFAALCDGWMKGSIRQFAEEIAFTPEATYRALAALSKAGRIEKIGRGHYQIRADSGL